MKDSHREKLRQLPLDRKLYLLQQNQHIKGGKDSHTAIRKNMPASNSSSSIFQPKTMRHKAPIKRSGTSSRLTGNPSTNSKPDVPPFNVTKDKSYMNDTLQSSPEVSTTTRDENTEGDIHDGTQESYDAARDKNEGQPLQHSKDANRENIGESGKPSDEQCFTTAEKNKAMFKRPEATNGRAAIYKYARKNLSNFDSTRSKVGSMILEFDALAHKQEDATTDESTAWLLLENKSLSRVPHKNNNNQRPSLNNLFSKTTMESASSSLVSNSYACQSLTRRDASHLVSLISSDDNNKRIKDRDSPYFYVEKLRSR